MEKYTDNFMYHLDCGTVKKGDPIETWINMLSDDKVVDLCYILDSMNEEERNEEKDYKIADIITLTQIIIENETKKELKFDIEYVENIMNKLSIGLSLELSVREGDITKTGVWRLTEDTSQYQITKQGEKKVEKLNDE